MNEQVSALESWRKKALEIERERERERTRWLGGSSKGDGARSAGGDEREQGMAGSAYFQHVARGVRDNIRSRVREELGQELQDRMRQREHETKCSAISTHSPPHTSPGAVATTPTPARHTSASPCRVSDDTALDMTSNQDSPFLAGDFLEITTCPPQSRADEQANGEIVPVVNKGKIRAALRAAPRTPQGGDGGSYGGGGGDGRDEAHDESVSVFDAESRVGDFGDAAGAEGSVGVGDAWGFTQKDAEWGGGMDPLRIFVAAFDSFHPKSLSPESERKRERERERLREREKEREKERERESQSVRKGWRDALLKDRSKHSG